MPNGTPAARGARPPGRIGMNRLDDRLWIHACDAEQDSSGPLRMPSTLLPLLERSNTDANQRRELATAMTYTRQCPSCSSAPRSLEVCRP